jgi:hypothetical protein
MAARSAHLTSIEVLRTFMASLRKFEQEITSAIDTLEMEGRRPADWVEHDRAHYWPAEEKKASHALSEARVALQKAEMAGSSSEQRYCYDERKMLEKAKRRLRTAEEKSQAVRRWRSRILKEVDEFLGQLTRMREYMGRDFQQSLVALQRMASALERYTETKPTPANSESSQTAMTTPVGEDAHESL